MAEETKPDRGCLATSASDLGQFPQSRPLDSTPGRPWKLHSQVSMLLPKLRVVVSSFPGPQRAQSEYLRPGRLEGRQQRGEAGGQPCCKGGPKHRDKILSHTVTSTPHLPQALIRLPVALWPQSITKASSTNEGVTGAWGGGLASSSSPHPPSACTQAPWEAGQG